MEVEMNEYIETVIIGAGQAGLATSYYLTQQRRDHLVLERSAHAGPVWRNERWDSFTLVTPNWAFHMPGVDHSVLDPDGFMTLSEVIAFYDHYPKQHKLPVEYNTLVEAVEPLDDHGYLVRTTGRSYKANNVVIATGRYQQPLIPPTASSLLPGINQCPSSRYRNPQSLPDGAVLVVGSGQSGCQIAEELLQHGRTVYLSTGTAGRAPRRYRGKDIIAWLDQVGFFDMIPEQLPPGMGKFHSIPHVSGTRGGHSINLHQFARDGMILLGHLRGITNDQVYFAPDLHENLARADQFEQDATQMIDKYIRAAGLDAPLDDLPQLRDGFSQPVIETLDLKDAGITSIIWAMGFTFDYSLVELPVFDADGYPVQKNGVSNYPGLYFVGLPWMPTERTGFLIGVGEAAQSIAAHIAGKTG